MADQVAAKKILSELSKREDLKNKVCNDCSNPNPQWASLSFAVFICLQCAGTHRGFGVHISFVRSISMDTWQDEQVRRMQLGGNGPFRQFMSSYAPSDQGGYKDGLSSYDTYHCWAATQYREKLDAMLAGKDWSPSAPSPALNANSRSSSPAPSATQGLRKSRASNRTFNARSDSHSPSSFSNNSPHGTPNLSNDQKSLNESYFANLGKANENRPADLPPSQGGRYQGFGSTPTPASNEHPSYGLSSAATPTLSDLQENPMAALSKGWSLFSAAVVGATKVVSENVIQPGMEKVNDPNFHASVRGYMTEAQKTAAMVGSTANQWSKNQFGVDVAENIGGVVGTVKERVGGGPGRSGYGSLSYDHDEETTGLYTDDDDMFGEYKDAQGQSPDQTNSAALYSNSGLHAPPNSTTTRGNSNAKTTKKSDWDDEWKDF